MWHGVARPLIAGSQCPGTEGHGAQPRGRCTDGEPASQPRSLPPRSAPRGAWNSVFLRRDDGAGLCWGLSSSFAAVQRGRATGGVPASPARRQAAETWRPVPHPTRWHTPGSGLRDPGTHSHGDHTAVYAPVCTHTRPGSHTPCTQEAGVRLRTWRAGSPSVSRPWLAGRAGEASSAALGALGPGLSRQPGSQAQEGGQERPEGRACGLRPRGMA